jgi:hypothetical protein
MEKLPEKSVDNSPDKLNFDSKKATIIFNIDKALLAFDQLRKTAENKGLVEKDKMHFTIIGSDTGEAILNKIKEMPVEEGQRLLQQIQKLAQEFSWDLLSQQDFFYLKKDYNDPDPSDPSKTIPETRESIIQMLWLKDLQPFYEKLSVLTGIDFKLPLPHVTLFTNSTRPDKKQRGIGIYSQSQFEELNPERV